MDGCRLPKLESTGRQHCGERHGLHDWHQPVPAAEGDWSEPMGGVSGQGETGAGSSDRGVASTAAGELFETETSNGTQC